MTVLTHADSCSLGVNDAGTFGEVDTRLTQARSRDVRRQLMTLAKVYEGSDAYYRAALRPIIKTVIGEET